MPNYNINDIDSSILNLSFFFFNFVLFLTHMSMSAYSLLKRQQKNKFLKWCQYSYCTPFEVALEVLTSVSQSFVSLNVQLKIFNI